MNQIEKEKTFWEFINLLDSKGLLQNVIIIGSWAEIFYEKKYNFLVKSMTNDIDILYKDINTEKNKILLTKELENLDFDVNIDRNRKIATYYKDGFELEVLTEMRGSNDSVNYIKSLGIYGEGLQYMDLITKYSVSTIVNGKSINIPNPSAYIIHKLIINHERLPIEKRQKDIDKVKNLLVYIKENNELVNDFREIYNYAINKYNKVKNLIDECCSNYDIDLSDILPEFSGDLTVYVLENNKYIRKTQEELFSLLFSGDSKKGRDWWYSLKDLIISKGNILKDCKYLIREKNNVN